MMEIESKKKKHKKQNKKQNKKKKLGAFSICRATLMALSDQGIQCAILPDFVLKTEQSMP